MCAGNSKGFSTSSLVEAVNHLGNKGVKLINLSVNAPPPYSIANSSVNSALHTYFKWFHDTQNGSDDSAHRQMVRRAVLLAICKEFEHP